MFCVFQSGTLTIKIHEMREFTNLILQVGYGVSGDDNNAEVDIKMSGDILFPEVSGPIPTINCIKHMLVN